MNRGTPKTFRLALALAAFVMSVFVTVGPIFVSADGGTTGSPTPVTGSPTSPATGTPTGPTTGGGTSTGSNSTDTGNAFNDNLICEPANNPGGSQATNTNVSTCINNIYLFAVGLVGFVSVLMIVFAGYLYITGGAENISKAKGYLTSVVAALAILFGTYAILYTINPNLTTTNNLVLDDVNCGQSSTGSCALNNLAIGSGLPSGGNTGSGGNGTGSGGTNSAGGNTLTIAASVSSNDNVGLQALINGQDGANNSQYSSYSWTDNGQALVGSATNTADPDTSLSGNGAGTVTDTVVVTANGNNGAQTLTANAQVQATFDSDGDATNVKIVSQGSGSGGSGGSESPRSVSDASTILSNSNISLSTNNDCPGNGPTQTLQAVAAGNLATYDGPNTTCNAGTTAVNSDMLDAIIDLATTDNYTFTITSITSGHHSSSSDPHYSGNAVDIAPSNTSQEGAFITDLYAYGASVVAIECSIPNLPHTYTVIQSGSPDNTGCQGQPGYHIHAQW